MPTENVRIIPINETQLEILASSGLYLAELKNGQVVDLYDYAYKNERYANMGESFFGKLEDSIKKVISKPLKYILPILAVGTGLAAAGVIKGGIFKTIAAKSGVADLVKAKNWTEINRVVRTTLQASGIMPTTEQVAAGVQEIIAETLAPTTTVTEVPITQPTTFGLSDEKLKEMLPYAAIAILVLILVLRK